MYYSDDQDDYSRDRDEDIRFADPAGRSALRAASKKNPRNLPCPTCLASKFGISYTQVWRIQNKQRWASTTKRA